MYKQYEEVQTDWNTESPIKDKVKSKQFPSLQNNAWMAIDLHIIVSAIQFCPCQSEEKKCKDNNPQPFSYTTNLSRQLWFWKKSRLKYVKLMYSCMNRVANFVPKVN